MRPGYQGAQGFMDNDEGRAATLLAQMTLAEKLGQLTMASGRLVLSGPVDPGDAVTEIRNGRAGSYLNASGVDELKHVQRIAVEESRLGIPVLFCADTLHGHRTIFPIPLAEACTFDRDLWEHTAAAAASEATAGGLHLTFAPMLDVSRDPRWGRIAESPGEDPTVGAAFARAKVRGFQVAAGSAKAPSASLPPGRRFAACAKHFVGYGAVLAGREYAEVDLSERALNEVHLPPFRAAVEEKTAAIMPGFHDLNGVPLSAHTVLLDGLLRERWGFGGILISDYNAIHELLNHGIAGDRAEAAALALKAGIDIDMMAGCYLNDLPKALDRGLVTMEDVDRAVMRVLDLKERLGLFEDPFAAFRREGENLPVHRRLARDAAARSMVLLKNRDGYLPWRKPPRRVAVMGPLAASARDLMGPWIDAGRPEETVDIAGGLAAAWPDATVVVAENAEGLKDADAIVLCLGEHADWSGEAASRAEPAVSPEQLEVARLALATGKPGVLVLVWGRPLILPDWLADSVAAILVAWFPGTEGGAALAELLDGRRNPSGRLSVTWPAVVGQAPIHLGLRPTGRPYYPDGWFVAGYRDGPNAPRFPFGAGLSWSRFELTDLALDRPSLGPGEAVTVSVTVANRGAQAGEDTLFLFSRDPVAAVTRPLLELRDFAKVTLAPGESKRVAFALKTECFDYLDADMQRRLDAGAIRLSVGHSAAEDDCLWIDLQVSLPAG
jgi:beta-glucosidase